MGADNNNYNGPERRMADRRELDDRRAATRFSDVLGRRSGVDRRLPVREELVYAWICNFYCAAGFSAGSSALIFTGLICISMPTKGWSI